MESLSKPKDVPQGVWDGLNDAGKINLLEWREHLKDAAHRADTSIYRLEVFFGLREEGARIIDTRRTA